MFSLKLLISILFYLISLSNQQQIPTRNYEENNYFLVELNTTTSQKPLIDFISKYKDHYKFEHQLNLDNYYVFSIDNSHPHNSFLGNFNSNNFNHMKRSSGFEDHYDELVGDVSSLHMLYPKKINKRMPVPIDSKRDELLQQQSSDQSNSDSDKAHQKLAVVAQKLDIHDPEFATQWHLLNLQFPGHDVNATGLWLEDILGQGIVTAIVDDGLDAEGEDLKDNFNAKGSWDFNDNGNLPLPKLFDDYHGTRCAGEIAAVKNDVCGIGVAYKSQVSGIRILSGAITAAEEAAALIYGLDTNDIYSCSWGPTDNGRTLSGPEVVVKQAFVKGIQEGRNNKGAIYVFASGNGGRFQDSCNFDGYTNSIYSITVGAIDYKGLHPAYSEACAAVMVVTYSSGSGEHIHTTDIKKKCSALHGGTSAAAPLASGIYSLILSANPDLTWRDLQYINVLSATPVNEDDGNYQTTALNRKYSHKYGYGKIDAYNMVDFAKSWKNVKPQAWYYSDVTQVNEALSLNKPQMLKRDEEKKIIKSKITVSKEDLKVMNVERIEHVNVIVNIDASFRGKVGARLISPTGVISDLATFRPGDAAGRGFQDWTFMSVAHWGEDGLGDWEIEVFADDSKSDPIDIKFKDWQLRFFGESRDADKSEKYELLKDYAAVRRDRIGENKQQSSTIESSTEFSSSTEASSSTTSSEEVSTTSASEEIAQSTSTASSEQVSSTSSEVSTTSSTITDELEPTTEPDEEGKNKHYTSDHTGQYLMGFAIIGFIIVLIIMKCHKSPGSLRRRRRRDDDYEFDIIPGEDYTDSEDDQETLDSRRRGANADSFDLGQRNDQRINKNDQINDDRYQDEARERLFENFNGETLPDYDDDMFKIGDDDDHENDENNTKKATSSSNEQPTDSNETTNDEEITDDRKIVDENK
ncbi:KEX2 [Candida jiufengensis]|uniref:KEX2 n=1 Tax=Candida jiufengensis TaxID=497108 RepID=UPI0022244ABA|nr:KEX2 [Candida jiufengensis]KAI5950776.1 KEX2 [Candida jiufengensis]